MNFTVTWLPPIPSDKEFHCVITVDDRRITATFGVGLAKVVLLNNITLAGNKRGRKEIPLHEYAAHANKKSNSSTHYLSAVANMQCTPHLLSRAGEWCTYLEALHISTARPLVTQEYINSILDTEKEFNHGKD